MHSTRPETTGKESAPAACLEAVRSITDDSARGHDQQQRLPYPVNRYDAHFREILSNAKVISFTKATDNKEVLFHVIVGFYFKQGVYIVIVFHWG